MHLGGGIHIAMNFYMCMCVALDGKILYTASDLRRFTQKVLLLYNTANVKTGIGTVHYEVYTDFNFVYLVCSV